MRHGGDTELLWAALFTSWPCKTACSLHHVATSAYSWWKEYAARKNDEEEEHVADSLLYDERCHLPRTTPPPDCVLKQREAESTGPQQPPTPTQ